MRSVRRSHSGFTLIEILIALVLLMVGIVGILTLFPVGIKNVSDSVEDSTAANIGQSLYAAMTEAMRRPNAAGDVILAHDGLAIVGAQTYTFKLPLSTGPVDLHPGAGLGTDPTLQVFQLGTDLRTQNVVNDITAPPAWSAGGDPSEPMRQYSFQFEVSKPSDALIVIRAPGTLGPTDAGLTDEVPMYRFRFLIYRNYEIQVVPPGEQHTRLVKDFTTVISGSGL